MSTSMLDALADEADAVTELGIQASRLAMEAAARANLLRTQIARLAVMERLQKNSGNQESPGTTPTAQGSGVGDQGSDASAPGGAAPRTSAESEQAVAEAVTGERVFEPRKDPAAAPDGQQRPAGE